LLFNSIKYLLFLPAVMALFWLSPKRWRVPILLGASYIFYMAWRPIYLLLILGLTLVNFWFGFRISESKEKKKAWMIGAVTVNLLTLAYFKYFYFFEDIATSLMKPWFGHVGKAPVNILLPLGISFFVFEFLHYVIEIYRGREPVRKFMDFALFAAFFPTQIAGPIKQFQDFVPQLKEHKVFSWSDFDQGMFLILSGLCKKVLLADNLSPFVNSGFANPQIFTGWDMWLFTVAFNFQIYFDFSGYADIARGSALLFGFKVPINFDFPYLTGSIAEFWQKWHITLGIWLRKYLFIPLGMTTNRWKSAKNLLIVMTLAGLWHGAGFHYILWGFYQGVLLAIHREFKLYRMNHEWTNVLDKPVGHVLSVTTTFLLVTLGMVVFRAEDMISACFILKKMLLPTELLQASTNALSTLAINSPLIFPSIFLLLPIFIFGQIFMRKLLRSGVLTQSPPILRAALVAVALVVLFAFAPDSSPRFIYYQF
jgi:D-alanyl-lipoteichoic acid acyltransferase DltB (MBOAT superfamily)